VLSGNRNFEGRIHPEVRANYLASPPLVVAYAIAGTVDIDFEREALGRDRAGEPVYLRDVWPSQQQIHDATATGVTSEMFAERYAHVFEGNAEWRALTAPEGDRFAWNELSTYVRRPPFLDVVGLTPPPLSDVRGARVLALLGDSVTTDHISPAGSIAPSGTAGRYLTDLHVQPMDFNSFGSRRGNHEVMMRGTFANVRLRNLLAPGTEGGWTRHLPDGEQMSTYDAAMRYMEEQVPLLVIAGREYGTGSSRDWAAKGVALLGVRAVLAESFERIHRSNLIAMGVLPLQFESGENAASLGLSGDEEYDITGIAEQLAPGKRMRVRARGRDGSTRVFHTIARIETPTELEYFRQGGIMPYVLRRLSGEDEAVEVTTA